MSYMDCVIREKIVFGINLRVIFESVKGFEFRNKYFLVRFIVDYIFFEFKCYWGYDLELVRKGCNEREFEIVEILCGLFIFMKIWINISY